MKKPSTQNITKYKIFVNAYNKTLRKAKLVYYDAKFKEYSRDIRKTWETLREILGRQKKRINILDFFHQGGEIIKG